MGEVELTWNLIDRASWSIFRIGAAFSWTMAAADRMNIAELRLLNAQDRLAGAGERLTQIDFRIADIQERMTYAQQDLNTATTQYFNAQAAVIKDQADLNRLMEESAGIRGELASVEENLINTQRIYNALIATGNADTIEGQQASENLTKARAAYNLVLSYAKPYIDAINEAQTRLNEDSREAIHWANEKEQADRQLDILTRQLTEATWTREAAERSEGVALRNLEINESRVSMQNWQLIGEAGILITQLPSAGRAVWDLGKAMSSAATTAGGLAPLLGSVGAKAAGAVGGVSGLGGALASFGIILGPIVAAIWMFISGLQYIEKYGAAAFTAETLGKMEEMWPDVRRGQYGYQGTVSRPTMFLAGEAGTEQVSISPLGGRRGGGTVVNAGMTVNIGKITDETDVNELLGKIDRHYMRAIKSLGGALR